MSLLNQKNLRYFHMAKAIREGKVVLPKKDLKLFVRCIKELMNPVPNSSPTLENQMDDPNQTEQNPIAKTFNQQGNFEEYIGKFSGLELKQKELESITNYSNAKPTKMDNFLVRYESSDEFNNNTITVVKKLREGTDLVFTIFQSSTQQGGMEPQGEKQTGENEIIVTKSRSFVNEIEGGKILADLLQKLDV